MEHETTMSRAQRGQMEGGGQVRKGGEGSRRKEEKLRSVALHVITLDIFPFNARACTVREISLTMWKLRRAELRREPCARSLASPSSPLVSDAVLITSLRAGSREKFQREQTTWSHITPFNFRMKFNVPRDREVDG